MTGTTGRKKLYKTVVRLATTCGPRKIGEEVGQRRGGRRSLGGRYDWPRGVETKRAKEPSPTYCETCSVWSWGRSGLVKPDTRVLGR